MATEYTVITDRLISILDAERTDVLSDDLAGGAVEAIRLGQYVPHENSEKRVIYVRFKRSGLKRRPAGGLQRDERMKFFITGAFWGTTQETAIEDCLNAAANVAQVLEHYPSDTGYWSAGSLGWQVGSDEEDGDDFVDVNIEAAANGCSAHFVLMWSCEVRIQRESLT
jgi:hypothetical protein